MAHSGQALPFKFRQAVQFELDLVRLVLVVKAPQADPGLG